MHNIAESDIGNHVTRKAKTERDATLVELCKTVTRGHAEQIALDGHDPDYSKRDAISAIIVPKLLAVINTRAFTMVGCKAKSGLFLLIERDDLAMSLAQDISLLKIA